MTDFVIEKDIPVIPGKSKASGKYPYRDMEVFDSFVVPREVADKVRQSCYSFGKKNGKKFVVRTDDKGVVRCWRLE